MGTFGNGVNGDGTVGLRIQIVECVEGGFCVTVQNHPGFMVDCEKWEDIPRCFSEQWKKYTEAM